MVGAQGGRVLRRRHVSGTWAARGRDDGADGDRPVARKPRRARARHDWPSSRSSGWASGASPPPCGRRRRTSPSRTPSASSATPSSSPWASGAARSSAAGWSCRFCPSWARPWSRPFVALAAMALAERSASVSSRRTARFSTRSATATRTPRSSSSALWPALALAGSPRVARAVRVGAFVTATACIQFALLSQSRGAIIGAGVALVVYLLSARNRLGALAWLLLAMAPAAFSVRRRRGALRRGEGRRRSEERCGRVELGRSLRPDPPPGRGGPGAWSRSSFEPRIRVAPAVGNRILLAGVAIVARRVRRRDREPRDLGGRPGLGVLRGRGRPFRELEPPDAQRGLEPLRDLAGRHGRERRRSDLRPGRRRLPVPVHPGARRSRPARARRPLGRARDAHRTRSGRPRPVPGSDGRRVRRRDPGPEARTVVRRSSRVVCWPRARTGSPTPRSTGSGPIRR